MKLRNLAYLLLIISFRLSAQEFNIELTNGKHQLSFDNLRIDSIIDARIEKKYVGYVNASTPAFFDSSIADYLKSLLSNQNFTDNKTGNLIIRVNKLLIYDQISMNSQSTNIEMNLSFIEKRDNKYYEVFQSAVNHMKNTNYAFKGIYNQNIITAFEISINQYLERKNSGKLNSDKINETVLSENPLADKLEYQINKIQKFKKGIYDSFYDFRDYNIDSLSNFTVTYQDKKNKTGKASINGINDDRVSKIWGFSDGEQNYCRLGSSFYPLIQEDSIFSVNNYPKETINSIYPVFGSFGLIGALAGTLVASASNGETGTVRTNTHEKYSLNLNNEKFYPSNEPSELKMQGNIVIISSQFNKADSKLEVYIDGNKKCDLTKSTYYKYDFNSSKLEFEICVVFNGEKFCYTSKPLLFNSELLLLIIKGNKVVIDKANMYLKRDLISAIEKDKITKVN